MRTTNFYFNLIWYLFTFSENERENFVHKRNGLIVVVWAKNPSCVTTIHSFLNHPVSVSNHWALSPSFYKLFWLRKSKFLFLHFLSHYRLWWHLRTCYFVTSSSCTLFASIRIGVLLYVPPICICIANTIYFFSVHFEEHILRRLLFSLSLRHTFWKIMVWGKQTTLPFPFWLHTFFLLINLQLRNMKIKKFSVKISSGIVWARQLFH